MSATARSQSMRSIVTIGSRWRRREGGQVVTVVQVHRADKLAEVCNAGTHHVWPISFTTLRREYDLLVSVEEYR